MHIPDVLKSLAGGSLLYFVMSACSGSSAGVDLLGAAGGDAAAPVGGDSGSGAGSGGSGSGSGVDGAVGASSSSGGGDGSSPVPDARADDAKAADAQEQSGSRLRATYYVAADGSKQFAHWTDTGRSNETCAFQVAEDGYPHCLPSFSYAQYYADAACTNPVATSGLGCANAGPKYVMPLEQSACGVLSPHPLYPVGSAISPATVYYKPSGSGCQAQGVSAGLTYFATGAAIVASTFVQAQLATE